MFFEVFLGFVLALSLLVLVHEAGHLLLARLTGCRVEEFAVGFKPALWQRKYGETTYILGSLPLGGYVKIWGENGSPELAEEAEDPHAFYNRPRAAQALVLLGGVLGNFLLAWLCFSLLLTRGLEVSSSQFPHHSLEDQRVVVVGVVEGYPAQETALARGDSFLRLHHPSSGETLEVSEGESWESVRDFLNQAGSFVLTLQEGGGANSLKEVELTSVSFEDRHIIGVQLDNLGTVTLPWSEALLQGLRVTGDFSLTILWFLGHFLLDLFHGQAASDELAGPIGIASLAGDSFHGGFDDFVWFLAVLSLNLAIFNLLPLPPLDGGRLLVVAIEGLLRRPLKPQWFQRLTMLGFIFLLSLLLVVTWFDLSRLLSGSSLP